VIARKRPEQRDDWYRHKREPERPRSPRRSATTRDGARFARCAAQDRHDAGARAFEAPVANDLCRLRTAVSGGNLYPQGLVPARLLGRRFSADRHAVERPHLPQRQAVWYDDEGGRRATASVKDGVLRGYFMGSYSAGKLA